MLQFEEMQLVKFLKLQYKNVEFYFDQLRYTVYIYVYIIEPNGKGLHSLVFEMLPSVPPQRVVQNV